MIKIVVGMLDVNFGWKSYHFDYRLLIRRTMNLFTRKKRKVTHDCHRKPALHTTPMHCSLFIEEVHSTEGAWRKCGVR
jgi:hypothetical protein